MGKGTDKLYITHSEWSSGDAYGASYGSNVSGKPPNGASFRRLPFNFCAASLQPFKNPVCTAEGTIFDVEVISAWLKKHKTNPVNGEPLDSKDLIRLNFSRNGEGDESGDLIDPVTFKVFTDNTHIVAVRHGQYANVFAWETIERMNVKAKMWRDLFDDTEFKRSDIITLQDPQNVGRRDLSQFKYLKDGGSALQVKGGQDEEAPELANVNIGSLGRLGDKVLKARYAVERARKEREAGGDINKSVTISSAKAVVASGNLISATRQNTRLPANAAAYTTGAAAASFTSTGLTPETKAERQILTDEDVLLKPKKIKIKGYARMETNFGDIVLELNPEYAPKAVWNFTRLAQKGFYDGVVFHRNIPGFMLQGGDPDGDGRGGQSIWGKYFEDEISGPWTHNARGIVSMANKGKNTNSSQFFITYAPTPHLDRKHTVFGRIASGMDVLTKLEAVPTDGSDRPLNKIVMKKVVVFVDPFAEFQTAQKDKDDAEAHEAELRRTGGTEDDKTTWTGKRIMDSEKPSASLGKVGKYIGTTRSRDEETDDLAGQWDEPAKKKFKSSGGGFGNFDDW